MKRKWLILMAIAITVLGLSLKLSNTLFAAPPLQTPATNTIAVDITVNDAGDLSVGGVNLSALGVGKLEGPMANLVKNLKNVHVTSDPKGVDVTVEGTQFVRIDWTPTSRQTVANLATRYGMPIQPEMQAQIEDWLNTTTLDLTARFTNEVSQPLNLSLSKVLRLDIQPDGALLLEKIPLPTTIDTNTLQTLERAGKQATVCWNKGIVTTSVDGAELPTVTLSPDGVSTLTQAANLPADLNAAPTLLGSRVGVDISLPGGSHVAGATCAE